MNNRPGYFYRILMALDQLANTVLLGDTDETLSARAHRTGSRWEPVIDFLFRWQGVTNHCEIAWLWEMKRMDLPPEYRRIRKRRGTKNEID